jgi:hypothetical protein
VTQPNGTRQVYRHRIGFIPDGVPKPEAGAEVVVPAKPDSQSSWRENLVPFAQTLTALATFIYVISR